VSFFKNRTVLGALCILLSLLICFAVTPLFNAGVSHKTSIVRVTKDIQAGQQITKDMVQTVEVGGYNLPSNVLKSPDSVVGKYAAADLAPGDYVLSTKVTGTPTVSNAYLSALNGSRQAISVTLKTLAEGVSGKLQPGDIVSVLAPDYQNQGSTVTPKELQYVEVIGVTTSGGADADQRDAGSSSSSTEDAEKNLPSTVTLLATPEQSAILAGLDADGKLHLALVYRGGKDNAQKFLDAQDKALKELYPDASSTVLMDSSGPAQGSSSSQTASSSGEGGQ
jgi:pilus assembly protein CpaB